MTATRRLEAAEIREEWLGHALSTQPADRPAAEAAITELYRLAERDAPVFVWVRSPAEAVPHIPPTPRLSASSESSKCRDWPLASVLASLQTQLRERLDGRIGLPRQRTFRLRIEVDDPPLPTRPRDVALAEVTQPLRQTVLDSLVGPVRLAHRPLTGDSRGLVWHGQHDAYWVGHYDAFRRCLGVRYPSRDEMQLGLWAAVARSCGWWWPSETMCVISERPVEVHTEAAGDEGQLRLHTSEGPAMRFADGWSVFSWHGTRVPRWVMNDLTVGRITAEPNVEVRRCAIERMGWDSYIDQAGLGLISTAADPGNPGSELQLYELPDRGRVLLAVNGSLERDGTRRRYGLAVPPSIDDPLTAAGWTYGLSAAQYSQLVRRT